MIRKFLAITFGIVLSMMIMTAPTTYALTLQYDGTDPIATGCANGAITAKSKWFGPNGSTLIELRYSPTCRTAWARITLPYPSDGGVQHSGGATVIRNQDLKEFTCIVPEGSRSCYTPQVNDAGYTSYAVGWYDNYVNYYDERTDSY